MNAAGFAEHRRDVQWEGTAAFIQPDEAGHEERL